MILIKTIQAVAGQGEASAAKEAPEQSVSPVIVMGTVLVAVFALLLIFLLVKRHQQQRQAAQFPPPQHSQ